MTLVGKGTIPFLEFHGARRTPEADFLRDYERHLDANTRVVVYGHPCYEGVRPHLLRALFERALSRGFRFATLAEIARSLDADSARPTPAPGAATEHAR